MFSFLALAALSALLFIAATVPRFALKNALMQTDMDGGQECITNLECIQVGSITTTYLTVTDTASIENLTVNNLNTTTINSNSFTTLCNVQLLEVFNMLTNDVLQGSTNRYWLDMQHTNALGQIDIYATLTPTNDAQFELPTNGFRGGLLSFNVLARGADRTLFFPTNFAAFNTNDGGLARAGSRFVVHLTNGNELRWTIQSNDTYSVMTKIFGQ